MNTKYNVMYNGNMALDKGIADLKTTYKDNYWEILPIERMQISQENILPGQTRNPNFDRAEEKAVKAIQKRSMNIDGKEKNPQMDEAHLLLGKARYYDQRFVPALEAFNYILYKYPESDKIYEAKIWRERTNMRMENDALAVKNLRKLLSEIKFKNQVFADANATLAQAFLNLNEQDSAISRLERAIEFTKHDEERARYRFILGQMYEADGEKEKAAGFYNSVIEMKRKSPRRYVLQAHNRLAGLQQMASSDTLAFVEKYKKLLKDRENRPYLDILNHQMALFYAGQKNTDKAIIYYNRSLRSKSEDQYLYASNYRNLADLYFDSAKYQTAGQYYDSTLTRLPGRSREYKLIKKKRENLADVIKFEAIAQQNDSILNVVALSPEDRKGFYEDYIKNLKKRDEAQARLEKEQRERDERAGRDAGTVDSPQLAPGSRTQTLNPAVAQQAGKMVPGGVATPGKPKGGAGASAGSGFYFYNTTSAAFGKLEFKKKWGSRKLTDNWRLSGVRDKGEDAAEKETEAEVAEEKKNEVEPRYSPEFYLQQLPTSQTVLDSLAKERNFAYYQLGVIYKEKFKEYQLAASKLEQLLRNNPEDRLVLPTKYNLYKIYEIIDKPKAEAMKSSIVMQYPDSRYAQILKNGTAAADVLSQTPDAAYERLYKRFEDGDYIVLLQELTTAIDQYTAEEIAPKMELLKAHTIGKLKGVTEYKKALNFVALNYPNAVEGKEAEALIKTDIPKLEKLQFNATEPLSYKIIYKVSNAHSDEVRKTINTIKKFVSERTIDKLTMSIDLYNMEEDFIVIHGIRTKDNAKDIASILKDYKDYKVSHDAIVISSDNYKVVQIKKNLEEYLADPDKPADKEAVVTPPPAPAKQPTPPAKPNKKPEPKQNMIELNSDDPAHNPQDEKSKSAGGIKQQDDKRMQGRPPAPKKP